MAARSRFDNLDTDEQEKILRNAGEEFADNGYAQASLNAIIEKAGISKGSLYYYFENKEDLFATVLERAVSEVVEHIGGFSVEELTEENFWEELERVITEVAAYTGRHPWYMRILRLFYRVRDNQPGDVRDSEMYQLARRLTDRVIERGQNLGVIRTDTSREFLVEMLLGVAEAGDRWLVDRFESDDDIDFEHEAKRQIEVYRRILEPREETS
jgi:AcrR family transcriptional regulator